MNNILIKNLELLMLKNIELHGSFNLAVSGGSTPIRLFNQLANNFKNLEKWKLVQRFVNIFWVDERCVDINDSESNSGVFIKIFDGVNLNFYPFNGVNKNLDEESNRYESIINSKVLLNDISIPSFDLILLGFGNDGHVASLFPNSSALNEKNKLISTNYIQQLDQFRLTMTYPLILSSKNIWLIYKEDKKPLLNKIISNEIKTPLNYVINNYENLIKYEIK